MLPIKVQNIPAMNLHKRQEFADMIRLEKLKPLSKSIMKVDTLDSKENNVIEDNGITLLGTSEGIIYNYKPSRR